jgi:hypothetical protein
MSGLLLFLTPHLQHEGCNVIPEHFSVIKKYYHASWRVHQRRQGLAQGRSSGQKQFLQHDFEVEARFFGEVFGVFFLFFVFVTRVISRICYPILTQ